ncbi:uncharacterized protein LOC126995964 [Eriocheir sinensis]|uniref:uncharacterized protein LOC126995964 n=1 Tax=Eriocheir sinensis TaxID=95602 RepID=UPI0021C9F980|nr:uncharacterized protein LOC126995964 [Eriocheir sinensis]
MKAGSDINITCVVKGAIRGAPVTWYHVLPRDPPKEELVEINAGGRGGVQLVTDKNSGTSWLLVTHATWRDAGNYTCAPVHATPASVSVHVLDEEAPAELQNDPQPSRAQTSTQGTPGLPLLLLGLHRLLGREGARTWCLWVLMVACLVLPNAIRGTSGLQDSSQTNKEAEALLKVAARDENRVPDVTLLRKQELKGGLRIPFGSYTPSSSFESFTSLYSSCFVSYTPSFSCLSLESYTTFSSSSSYSSSRRHHHRPLSVPTSTCFDLSSSSSSSCPSLTHASCTSPAHAFHPQL